MKNKLQVRLPDHIKPERYEIFLKPDLKRFVFEGEEKILIYFGRPVKEITLHSKDLEIEKVELQISNSKILISKQILNSKSETVTFKLSKPAPKGKGELKIKFKGILSDKLKGFYRSKYSHKGEEKYIATTQFEATDARAAFPCFDEPHKKAVFDVTFLVPKDLAVISNTVEDSIIYHPDDKSMPAGRSLSMPFEHQSGYKIVKFRQTPKMSTYLLAFIVGDFEHIEGWAVRGGKKKTLVRVFTTPGKKHQAKFALETAIKCLEFYEEYFDIPYPLPVLDLIAIPDFASAAMENWGAITYRETALLVDEEHTSSANKQWVAIVIAHELAHQWFGNLVTMRWWTDLWLNEGFASYMEYLATDKLFPKWHMWRQYVSERFAAALKLDALENTHPIEIEVSHPDEIWEIFDSVSYAKGSAVIRMLADYLGEEIFRNGLRHYLKKHAYGNTDTSDLWKAFEEVSGRPVVKMMRGWTRQAGHPVIYAKQQKNFIELSQQRFYSSELSAHKSKDKSIWTIPVTIKDDSGRIFTELIGKKTAKLQFPQASWLKLNYGERGVYRSGYSPELFARLEQAVKNGELEPSDRLGVARDAFNLAQAGQFSTVSALKLASYYRLETELPVWEEIASGFAAVHNLFRGTDLEDDLKKYFRSVLAAAAKKTGWTPKKGEPHTAPLLRSLLLGQLGAYGDPEVLKKSYALFELARKGGRIPVDLRSVVYAQAAANGGAKEFETLIKMYGSNSHHEEQDRVGRALGNFKDKRILGLAIKFALSPKVRTQDSPGIFIQAARNFYGRDLAWDYLTKNWGEIEPRYNTGGHLLEWFVAGFSSFTDKSDAEKIQKFFKRNPTPALKRSVAQVIERVRSQNSWKKRELKNVRRWLNQL